MLPRSAPAHLNDEQRRFFELNGYLIIKGALAAEQIAHFLSIVDGVEQRQRASAGVPGGQFLEVRNAVAREHALLELLDWPSTFPLVAELMGPAIQLNTSHVMVRPPQPAGTAATFKAIDWHRDGCAEVFPVHGTFPWIYTKIGYFLTDLSRPGMGNLRVIPGSHLRAEQPDHPAGRIDPEGAIEVLTKPGDAVIFQQRMWHAVGPNYSASTRKNIYMGYSYRWVKPLDFMLPEPQLLALATPIQRQLLGEYASEMTYWIPKENEVPLRAWLKEHTEATVSH